MKELMAFQMKLWALPLIICVVGAITHTNQPEHVARFSVIGAPFLLFQILGFGWLKGYQRALANHSIVEPDNPIGSEGSI